MKSTKRPYSSRNTNENQSTLSRFFRPIDKDGSEAKKHCTQSNSGENGHDPVVRSKPACSTLSSNTYDRLSVFKSTEPTVVEQGSSSPLLSGNRLPNSEKLFAREEVIVSDDSGGEESGRNCQAVGLKFQSPGSSFGQARSSKGGSSGKALPYTPLEKQYMQIRDANPGVLLMVECGYKYRFFGEDAEIAAKELNIFCNLMHNFMNASIPVHRLSVHVRRLVMAGYKVGVVRQTETAALKAAGDNRNTVFERRLTSLFTMATLIGEDFKSLCALSSSNKEGSSDLNDEDTSWHATADNYLLILCESSRPLAGSDDGKTAVEPQSRKRLMSTVAIVAIQPGTGDVVYDSFDDDARRSSLRTRLAHICPCELLLPANLSPATQKALDDFCASRRSQGDVVRSERLITGVIEYSSALGQLSDFYAVAEMCQYQLSDEDSSDDESRVDENQRNCSVSSDKGRHGQFVANLPELVVVSLAYLVRHLGQFGLSSILRDTDNFVQFTDSVQHLLLNEQTLRSLEIFHNTTDNKETGSLFSLVCHTSTSFGRRLLRRWVAQPLINARLIARRHDAVEALVEHCKTLCVTRMKALLSHMPDVSHGVCAAIHQKCSPSEFYTTVKALSGAVSELLSISEEAHATLCSAMLLQIVDEVPTLLEGVDVIFSALNPSAAKLGDKLNLFSDLSRFPDVAKTKKVLEDITSELLAHRKEFRQTLRQPLADYKSVSGEDYLIEVSNKQLACIPHSWHRVSSTKQVTRFRTPFVVESLKRSAQLTEKLQEQCHAAWLQFLGEFKRKFGQGSRRAVDHLATLDCLMSLSRLAGQPGYTRPTMLCQSDGAEVRLEILAGRHCVVETFMSGESGAQFVANDTKMTSSQNRVSIITGPNMGGKSCYVRQVALIVILAQIGSFVPAEQATLSVLDGVFVRMGAADSLQDGRSTFMVELQETSDILRLASPRSLVILDELGRGTSTHDGVAVAYATLHHFITQIKSCVLFVTHYPLLAELSAMFPSEVVVFHMAFFSHEDDDDEITFLYQLVEGLAARSYGLNVARLAGISSDLLQQASVKSSQLEQDIQRKRLLVESFYRKWRQPGGDTDCNATN